MPPLKKNANNNYEISKTRYLKIKEALHNIGVLLNIMREYCNYNAKNEKIYCLTALIEQIQFEKTKITEKF